jgi:hypothetical protein
MSEEKEELSGIRREMATIGLALSVIAMNQVGAGGAEERERHNQASTKALNLLLKRIESL